MLEGGYVETPEQLIFTVKGLVHPPHRIIAYLRYMADPKGERVRSNVRYRRIYGFEEQLSIIRSRYPQYLHYDEVFDVELQSVPRKKIWRVYDPSKGLMEVMNRIRDPLAQAAKSFAEEISSASGVDLNDMGISGSLLLSLHTHTSDIDLIVYGIVNSIKVQRALRKLLDEEDHFKRFNEEYLKKLFEFRSSETPMSYDVFVKQERRKVIQGVYRGYTYFIRFVKDLHEIGETYGERRSRGLGRAKVRAVVTDDSESLFTPCTYKVRCLEVVSGSVNSSLLKEVTSFRGRFSEQAVKGEVIEVEGRLEEVNFKGLRYQRIVVGASGDYMVALNFVENEE